MSPSIPTTPTPATTAKVAIVTGASSGIGWATVEQLVSEGWTVLAVARRKERLQRLSHNTGCHYVAADVSTAEGVQAVMDAASALGPITVLVNNAGGARGLDSITDAQVDQWQHMYDINVLTALRMTQAVVPTMCTHGGTIVFVTSTAAHDTYPGGGGYVAAKHAERMIPRTLRQELVGKPVRIVEIAPGLVHTEEFSLRRLGSQEAADQVYAGVNHPLVAEDIAEAICWCIRLPSHVTIDSMIIRPVEEATNTRSQRLQESNTSEQ